MITDFSRGHLKLTIMNRTVTIEGEMFFPDKEKLGFVVYSDRIKFWDPPFDKVAIGGDEKLEILNELKSEFMKKSRILEIE